MKKYRLALWSSILLQFAAVPLEAANLLQNPNFNGSLASWVAPYATYDATRSATADGTGSALAGFTLPSNAAYGNANGVEQCVDGIVPGTSYDFGGKVFIPSGQVGLGGGGSVYIQWYGSAGCTGTLTGNTNTAIALAPPSSTNVWYPLLASATAPAGTSSVLVIGEIQNNAGDGATFSVSFDELFLQTTPPVPQSVSVAIPTVGMAGSGLLVLSLAGAALFLLRRGA
jgi:hypothetical protein